MKYAKYLVCALLFLASACKKDSDFDKQVGEYRNAFLASSEIGAYQNGAAVVRFSKTNHQLGMSSDKPLFRITDNAGVQFVELTLDAMPTGDQAVGGKMAVAGFSAAEFNASDIKLLKQEDGLVWLWSDSAATGMIMPWIEL